MEKNVRSIEADGLVWGQAKLVPVGYGIKKLQIACVVEDDKVGIDFLEEEITKFEDFVSWLTGVLHYADHISWFKLICNFELILN